MKITLESLRLSNFMGVSEQTYSFGNQTSIFGTNGSGKTTIATAFTWLFFGKDIYGKKDFAYKPLKQSGEHEHNLETEVEGIFDIDGKKVTLLRRSTEKWVKPRGAEHAEYTGDETAYFVNEVPFKQKEYVEYIDSLVNEDLFRLITSTSYFNGLKWTERRAMLMTLSRDVSDRAVIDSNLELKPLIEASEKWSMEDYKKVISGRIKSLKVDRDSLPSRIDEVMKSIVDVDYAETESNLLKLEAELAKLDLQINSGSSNAKQLKEINSRIVSANSEIRKLVSEIDGLTENKKAKVEREISNLKSDIERISQRIDGNKRLKESGEKEIEKLRMERDKIKAEEFIAPSSPDCCPTCGQDYPAHLQAELVDKAMKQFKESQIERINNKNAVGKMTVDKVASISKSIIDDETERDKKHDALNELLSVGAELTAEEQAKVDARKAKLSELYAEVNRLTQESESFATDPNVALIERKKSIQSQITELSKVIGQRNFMESQKARAKELEESEEGLSKQLLDAEREDYLLQLFSRAKAKLMESEINHHFEYVSFKLFNVLKNGNIEECCDTLVDGVDWNDSLNSGAKINAGLDIIRTFNKVKDVYAPVFIDNSESVVETVPLETQTIKLIVSEKDKTLRFE